jgi:nucleoside-diphosphate-sugar epimerase
MTAAKPVLITGATGFIGGRLATRLASEGCAVRCLVRDPKKRVPAAAEVVAGDLRTGAGLEQAVQGAAVIYHVAGVTKALADSDYHAGNVLGTQNLLAACAANPPERFVHVSSVAAMHPVSVYAKSKLAGEELVRASAVASRAVIVRPPMVYGPGDKDVLRFFRSVAAGWIVSVGGGGQQVSYIHVDDLVDALLLAGRSERAAGNTYGIANQGPIRWPELGRIAAGLMNRQARLVRIPLWAASAAAEVLQIGARLSGKPSILCPDKIREARQMDWTCDPAPARADLGFEPRRSLEQGLAETLAWYRDSGWLRY